MYTKRTKAANGFTSRGGICFPSGRLVVKQKRNDTYMSDDISVESMMQIVTSLSR